MDALFMNKEKIATLLPMKECIRVMEKAFHSLFTIDRSRALSSQDF
jgi:hypothetical protein